MTEFLFWLLAILAVYSYFLYPSILALLSRTAARPLRPVAGEAPPPMSLIITAFNESGRIRAKIENSLAIDCPELEIIIASDCSTDDTDAIVAEYADRVRLVRAGERLGKENAQWCAIQQARGEILVFSDVATEIPADALTRLAAYFADPTIGAVSSEDRFIGQEGAVGGGGGGEGAYVKYEMWLRRMESGLAGLVGLSGSFFAARSAVCQQWDIHSPSDFNTGLNCARAGYRAVTAPDVLGYYKDLADPQKEYQRKVRTVLRGITAIARHPDVLNPGKYGLFAFQVWSHKVMRWGVPWFLLLLFLLSFRLLGEGWVYTLAFLGQLAFYGIAIGAHISEGLRANALARLVYFFVQVNLGIADATCKFVGGKRMTTWQPSAR